MKLFRGWRGVAALAIVAALGACGGGGGGSATPPPSPVPLPVPTAVPPPAAIPPLSLWAGNAGGRGNLDGTGDQARFWDPAGVAADSKGNVFVVDNFLNTIRKITPDGTVTTFAGISGLSGSSDGPGVGASFNFDKPSSIAVDKADNLYVADVGNNLIRKITPAGVVSTVAGHAGSYGSADGAGTKASLDFCYEEIGCVAPGMAFDSSGTLYFVEAGSRKIRKMSAAGQVSTIGGETCGYPARDYRVTGLAVDAADTLYLSDPFNIRIMGADGRMIPYAGARRDGGHVDGTGEAARFMYAVGLAVDKAGALHTLDNGQLRKIAKGGVVSTVAGDPNYSRQAGSRDGQGLAAKFSYPSAVAADPMGNIYVSDTGNQSIRKITPAGMVSTLAGQADATGWVDGIGTAARFGYIGGMAFDRTGNLFLSDDLSHSIRKVTSGGVVTTFAGGGDTDWSHKDGTGAAARFFNPGGLAFDAAGVLHVADTFSNSIRRITADAVVSTMAAPTFTDAGSFPTANAYFYPRGVAFDSAGNLYVADSGNHSVRKIDTAGRASTLAGRTTGQAGAEDGVGQAARFYGPAAVVADRAGNLFVTDEHNHTIRKITPDGTVTTFAGAALQPGFADGAGAAARFQRPGGIAIDGVDNLYVADSYNMAVRKITPAGVVSTVVGTPGLAGFRPGPLPGSLLFPSALAIKGRSLYIATSKGIVIAADVL